MSISICQKEALSSFIELYLSDESDAWVFQNVYPIVTASFLHGLAQDLVNLFKSKVPDLCASRYHTFSKDNGMETIL
jgi:hypothetical protein